MGIFDREIDRPAYQEMMRRVRRGEFTHILVGKLAHLQHDYDDLRKVLVELAECEILLINVTEANLLTGKSPVI